MPFQIRASPVNRPASGGFDVGRLSKGVRFADGVANRAGANVLTLDQAVKQMDFDVVYRRTDWNDSAIQARRRVARKYEVLVPVDIPLKMIQGA